MKWTTLVETVDIDTGEIVPPGEIANYTTIKVEHLPSHYGKTRSIKKIRRIAKRNAQQELFPTSGTKPNT